MNSDGESSAQKLRKKWSKALLWTRRHVPTGLRTVIGIMLIIGGVLGFLPILGFWMIPLGLAVIAIDVEVLGKHVRRSWRKTSTGESDTATRQKDEVEK
jgi:hypothetical protein